MLGITLQRLRSAFYIFSVSSILLASIGTGALISGLDMPVVEVGKVIFQITVALTPAMNGTFSQPIQIVDGGYYDAYVAPDPGSNFVEMKETYLSVSPHGQLLDETYASSVGVNSFHVFAFDLKPGAYYVVTLFNLTDASLEYGFRIFVYHTARVPDPYRIPEIAAFIGSFASAIIGGTCWAVIKRRSPSVKLGIKAESIVVFVAALVAFISTVLPWYAFSFEGHPVTTYSLQTLLEYGLTMPFEPAIGKASFILLAYTLLVVGGFFALLGAFFWNVYNGKSLYGLLAVSGILVILSPAAFALGFASLEIPLYGQGGASPYSILAFLSYGFFSAAIAGLLMLIVAILTPVSAHESPPAKLNETPPHEFTREEESQNTNNGRDGICTSHPLVDNRAVDHVVLEKQI